MKRRLVDTRVGQFIKQPVQRALGELGWELRRFEGTGSSAPARLIQRHGIKTVLDVGANVGQYGTRLRLAGYRGPILSFEPGPVAFAQLERAVRNDSAWHAVMVAAGSEPDELTLEVSQNSTSSSLLPIAERHVQAAPSSAVTSRVSVQVDRIDSVVASHPGLSAPYLLKLDVQGFELAALDGASDILSCTPVVTAELSFAELFEGGARYIEVLTRLDALGYIPVEIEPGFREPATGELLQCDVTMVRAE